MVLGLSGGADSVALLLLLLEQDVEVVAAHANFQLRGEESERDEAFVRELCEQKGVTLRVQRFDTRNEAKRSGESIEMAARRLRYAWFRELSEAYQAVVCTAHHRNDQAETLLLNLVRGSGIQGLGGMSPLSEDGIWRPLLNVERADIEDYLKEHAQPYVTDSTNLQTDYKRNKIRHEVLPLLQALNPAIVSTLADTAERLREARYFYQKGLDSELSEMLHEEDGISSLLLASLRQHPARLTLIHQAVGNLFPTAMHPQIAALIDAQPGKYFQHGDTLIVRGRDAIEWGNPNEPLLPKSKVVVDADKLHGTLRLRPLEKGDRFQPYGLKGTKLANDFLADRHVSLLRRLKARVLCDDIGFVWLVGYEIDQRVALTAETTKSITLSSDNLPI